MNKLFLGTLAFIGTTEFCTLHAAPIPLQELLDRQEIVEISPAVVDGRPVEADVDSRPGFICRALGYTRFVSYEPEIKSGVIPIGFRYWKVTEEGGFLPQEITEPTIGILILIKSLSCAGRTQ